LIDTVGLVCSQEFSFVHTSQKQEASMGNTLGKIFGWTTSTSASSREATKETGVVASTTLGVGGGAGAFDAKLVAKYEAAGQGHVFAFADKLTKDEVAKLSAQLEAVDLEYVASAFKSSTGSESIESVNKKASIGAFPLDRIAAADTSQDKKDEWNQLGLAAIKKGQYDTIRLSVCLSVPTYICMRVDGWVHAERG
jgi:hypothetical protein